jgi:hypothetical protein
MNWVDVEPWCEARELRDRYPEPCESFTYPHGYTTRTLKPGVVLRMQDGRVLVVGNINTLNGVCDDCTERGTVVAYSLDLVQAVASATQRCGCGAYIMSKSRAYAEQHRGLLELDERGNKHTYEACGEEA